MAHRPIHAKKIARLRKALRTTLPAYIDLVDYLRLRGYADTKGQALKLIESGRVRSDSHKLEHRLVDAKLRRSIVVLDG